MQIAFSLGLQIVNFLHWFCDSQFKPSGGIHKLLFWGWHSGEVQPWSIEEREGEGTSLLFARDKATIESQNQLGKF
jgi:hypothetical protein